MPATPVWTSLPDGPEARAFHAAAYDPLSNRMVVFGGSGSSGYRNDVWVLDNANGAGSGPAAWSLATPMGTPPDARAVFYHYQLYDPATRRLLVFGGDDNTGAPALTDYWVLTDAVGSLAGASLKLDVHGSGGSSNLNGVLEPGESVVVEPAWLNISAASLGLTGTASLFEGPPAGGTTYTIVDGAADYGTLAAGTSGDCFAATQDCYELAVSGPRPVPHWDAIFAESLSVDPGQDLDSAHRRELWRRADPERLLPAHREHLPSRRHDRLQRHRLLPEEPALRKQMAVFVLKAKEGAAYLPPPGNGDFLRCPGERPVRPVDGGDCIAGASSRVASDPGPRSTARTIRSCGSRWPCSCCSRSRAPVTRRRPAPGSLPTSHAPASSPIGSRTCRCARSPPVAAKEISVPRRRRRAPRWRRFWPFISRRP